MLTIQINDGGLSDRMRIAADDFRRFASAGIKEGLSIVQEEARINHPGFTTRGGGADQSVQDEFDPQTFVGSVYLDKGIAFYSIYLHEGTGLFGYKKQRIKARRRVMAFQGADGRPAFATSTKGHPGDPFVYRAAFKKMPDFLDALNKSVHDGLKKAGLL